ncbi:MAG: hypothetical protein JWO41_123 [Candidatus Saccharibacteria bacterium]|nr:hypothetical protein [Candidatus Saccharibacteria bacterium]
MISLFLAAGVAAFVYSKMGRRIGYGNSVDVWKLVAISFVLGFGFFFSLTTWVIHLH